MKFSFRFSYPYSLSFVLLFISAKGLSQTLPDLQDTTPVEFVAYWHANDVYNFNVYKIKKQWSGETLKKADSIVYKASFTVLEENDSSYLIKWSQEYDLFTESRFTVLTQQLKKETNQLFDLDIIYRTSPTGEFLNIENWEEIGKAYTAYLETLITSLGKDRQKELRQTLAPFLLMMNTEAGITQIASPVITLFHFPMGASFNPADTIWYEDQLPNLFSNDFIDAESVIYFDEVDRDEEYCTFFHQMFIDPDGAKEMLKSMFLQMNLKSEEADKFIADATLNIEDFKYFAYYYNPCVPVYISSSRTTDISLNGETTSSIEETIIEFTGYEESNPLPEGN